jgi:hypothetical protein
VERRRWISRLDPRGAAAAAPLALARLGLAALALTSAVAARTSSPVARAVAFHSEPRIEPQGDPKGEPKKEAARAAPQAALDAARRALERGALAECAVHARAALAVDPRSEAAYALLLAACGSDLDARTWWSYELAAALADARGELKLAPQTQALLPEGNPHVAALARARAGAVEELLELFAAARKECDKEADRGVVAAWAAGLAREIAYASPALHEVAREAAPLGVPSSSAAQRETIEALARKLAALQAAGQHAAAIEFALVLRGLGAQAAFEDLEGPPASPKFRPAFEAGGAALERARAALAKTKQPLTVEELAAMDAELRDAFTREHASFANPGIARSPQGWYRIETNCGHATLLGAAETVEAHHARLARWYGSDPFVGKPGVVRVVPESHGLESEGAPFWWAGGFQGGDTTTLRFACSSISDLGRGLTHELTHRFDGVLHPGIPAWLAEGRAVWTAAAYAQDTDEEFVARHASFGTLDDARFRGYGGREKLEQLVAGTIEDYRDNYVAGYALFVFLATWHDEGAPPKYAEQLAKYQTSRRSDKRAPLAAFVAHFCDGAGGRPKDFAAFAAEFDAFISGFYWRDRKPFTQRYLESPGPSSASPTVLDEPTWVWSRARAEPWFGQDQAREAARLLLREGDVRGAAAAYLWSLSVDEPSSEVERSFHELLASAGKRGAAWILGRAAALRDGEADFEADSEYHFRRPAKAKAWLAALAAAATHAHDNGLHRTAHALRADHDRVARRLGAASLALAVPRPAAPSELVPFDAPPRNGLRLGWVEERHTAFERHRVEGLWFVDEREHLHVGRNKPRTASGVADRAAHLHHVFVRSRSPLEAGRYSIRARITPTTSFVSGALTLGFTRRDRFVTVDFSGGDYDYAVLGDKEEASELESIGWGLHGSFERDGGLGGSLAGGQHGFGKVVSSFELEVLVDGALVHLVIDGERVGTYHTPTGVEVAGYFGFGVSMGDYRVSELEVRRLDRSAPGALRATRGELGAIESWDLGLPRRSSFLQLVNRSVRGVPSHARGSLLLALPALEGDDPEALEQRRERIEEFQLFRERYGLSLPAYVIAPGADDQQLAALGAALAAPSNAGSIAPAQLLNVFPSQAAERDEFRALRKAGELAADDGASWLLFIDSARVLRVASGFHKTKRLEGSLERWVEVFRNR